MKDGGGKITKIAQGWILCGIRVSGVRRILRVRRQVGGPLDDATADQAPAYLFRS